MRLFNGQLVVIVQASSEPGTVTLKVNDARRGLTESVAIAVK